MATDRMIRIPLLSTLTVEAPAQVGGHTVLLSVGLGHLEDTEAGTRLCLDLAAAPYERRLYIWLRDVRRLESEGATDFEEDAGAHLPH